MILKLKQTPGEIQNDGALPAGGTSAERFLAVKEEDRGPARRF